MGMELPRTRAAQNAQQRCRKEGKNVAQRAQHLLDITLSLVCHGGFKRVPLINENVDQERREVAKDKTKDSTRPCKSS